MSEANPMVWVEFHAPHDHPIAPGQIVAYLPGMRCSVHRTCHDLAVLRDTGKAIDTPPADHAEQYKADPYWRPTE